MSINEYSCARTSNAVSDEIGRPGSVSPPYKMRVEVTYVDVEKEQVFCKQTDKKALYMDLRTKMDNSLAVSSEPAAEIEKGRLYAVEFQLNWYRAELLWVNRDDKRACVRFIDVGCLRILSTSELFVLDNCFTMKPYNLRFVTEFSTPAKNASALEQAGFLSCSKITEGQRLMAFVLTDAEPCMALFRKDERQSSKFSSSFSLPDPRIIRRKSSFTKSLTPQCFRRFIPQKPLSFYSSFSERDLSSGFLSDASDTRSPRITTKEAKEMDGPFRIPQLPSRFGPSGFHNRATGFQFIRSFSGARRSRIDSSSTATMSSNDSDTKNDVFTRSLVDFNKGKVRFASSVSTCTEDTNMENEEDNSLPQNQWCVKAKVLNVNNARDIYVETPETKERALELERMLEQVNVDSLEQLQPALLVPGEDVLAVSKDDVKRRVRVLHSNKDGIGLKCVDTGEEFYPAPEEWPFYRLGSELGSVEPTCVGPLRLAGDCTSNWMTLNSGIKLRELCEDVCSAQFGGTEKSRWVYLYNSQDQDINAIFASYARTSGLRRKLSHGEV